jgi:hypothetical protein
MATIKSNTFESAYVGPGTTVAAANSSVSLGNAFNTTLKDVTCTDFIYDAAQSMHGRYSAKIVTTANWNGSATATWNVSVPGSYYYTRVYIRTAAAPVSSGSITYPGIANTSVGLSTASKFVLNAPGSNEATLVTGTYTYLANTWYRVEIQGLISATVGQMTSNIYLGDSLTPVETLQSPATWNVAAPTTFGIGVGFMWTPQAVTLWFDDVAFSDLDWIGPSSDKLTVVTPNNRGFHPAMFKPSRVR